MLQIPNIEITPEILRLVSEVDEFKGKWKATNYVSDKYLAQLEQGRVVTGSASVMKLVGVRLVYRVAKTIYSERISYSFTRPEEKQVLGYIEALEYIHKNHMNIACTESYLKQLHVMLQRYSTKPLHVQGGYKRIPNKLVSAHEPGGDNPLVIGFETARPYESPTKVASLMQWLDKSLREDKLHPLILVAMWLGMFLTISPFQEGNKRTAFVMSYLILLRTGYSFMRYSALEAVFEQDYDVFYETLSLTQQSDCSSSVQEWHKWLVYILRCVRKQKNELLTILDDAYYQEQSSLNTLSLRIMELFNHHSRLTISDIVTFTGANRNTVKLRLRELARDKYITRHGKARATWYTVA